MGIEKRKHIRVPLKILVDIYDKSGLIKSRGCIIDISMGGLGIESEMDLGFNSEIIIDVLLPGAPIRVSGKIVYKHEELRGLYKYGILYTKMSMFDKLKLKKHINNFLESQSNKPPAYPNP